MRPVNILSKSLLTVGTVLGLIFAQSAAALVTVDAATAAVGPVAVGETFDVDVTVTWDGGGDLLGVFSSHEWDNTQLDLTNAVFPLATAFETRPVLLAMGAYYPGMGRLGTIADGVAGDDLSSTARTVQYAKAPPAVDAGNAASQVIVRLTFLVVGVGDGIAEVDGFFNQGDIGAEGDTFTFGSNVAISVPEPSSAMLGLSALGCVFAVVSVRRRD
jgi:hypothetical protein